MSQSAVKNAKVNLSEKQSLLKKVMEKLRKVEALVSRAENEVKLAEQEYELQVKIQRSQEAPQNTGNHGSEGTQMTLDYHKTVTVNAKIKNNPTIEIKKTSAQKRKFSKKSSKKGKKVKLLPLNPMIFYARFPHITEKIFQNLDEDSLKSSRLVSKSWQNCIDNQNILWKKILKDEDAERAFQLACTSGHL